MTCEGSKAMGWEDHGLIAPQFAQALKQVCVKMRLSKNSIEECEALPCSAVGSRDALGSSNRRRPTLGVETDDLMKVRELSHSQRNLIKDKMMPPHTLRASAFGPHSKRCCWTNSFRRFLVGGYSRRSSQTTFLFLLECYYRNLGLEALGMFGTHLEAER